MQVDKITWNVHAHDEAALFRLDCAEHDAIDKNGASMSKLAALQQHLTIQQAALIADQRFDVLQIIIRQMGTQPPSQKITGIYQALL